MNNEYQVISLGEECRKDWSEFVYNHPHGNIFQTPEMRVVYERTKNYEPISLAVVDANGEILALMQAVVIRSMKGFLGSFSARSIIQGGPLCVDGEMGVEALRILMEKYDKFAKEKTIYTQIRNIWDTSKFYSILKELGYQYEEHLNFLIDLDRSEENIWRDIHKSRRKGINRSKKSGLDVETIDNEKNIKMFYEIVRQTYRNAKVPIDDFSLFESVFRLLSAKNMAKFYLAKHESVYVGARATLNYNGLIYDWFAGSLHTYSSLYINERLVWHILKESTNNGYHTFDFGGAGNPDKEYGVREFKRRFGGMMVNYGRYKKIHSHIKMKIAERGFEAYRKVML
ncbi:MAG: hypothetical protein C5S48_10135 [Candidatus Methanogaster sp.]|nr:MAG: hypothetical protein C5S48_10135 [ANME-2 cluster archaeon]